MPETILSRLQRYDFRRIPSAVIRSRLHELAGREGAAIADSALTLLAREASGSMRDGERMLETALASLGGQINENELAGILGVASRTRTFQIIEAILDQDAATALQAARELNQRGANLESLSRDLLETMRNLAVARLPAANGANALLAELPDQEAAEVQRLSTKASGRDLMRLFRLMAEAQEQLARSSFPDLMLEMTMIRMATLAPVLDADELIRAIGAAGGSGNSSGDDSASRPAAPRSTEEQPPRRGRAPAGSSAAQSPDSAAAVLSSSLPPDSALRRIPFEGEVKADAPARAALPIAPVSEPRVEAGELPDLRDFIRSRRAALAGFMEQGAALKLDGDVLTVTPRSDIYVRYLADNRLVIGELASELYGRRIKVEMGNGGAATGSARLESPGEAATDSAATASAAALVRLSPDATTEKETAGSAASASVPRQAAADRQRLYADPLVQRIFAEFDARLVDFRGPGASSASKK
jgi:DNA polymerase-3 subunit gamma/tau